MVRALKERYDAVIVGSGPNGLAAAITLAEAGRSVLVLESDNTIGGGTRSASLTLPGFIHDICSTVHPLAVVSPFFRKLESAPRKIEWVHPDIPLAHLFEDGTAVILERSLEATMESFGLDGAAYGKLMKPMLPVWEDLIGDILAPLHWPHRPMIMAHFGFHALRSLRHFAGKYFQDEKVQGFLAGLAAHGMVPLEWPATTSFALVLAILGHVTGWPFARGGSVQIAGCLAEHLRALGGEIITDMPVVNVDDLPQARDILLDVTPRQVLSMAGHHFPNGYRRKLERFRYGSGVFKIDWALDGPIPWKAQVCQKAGIVHLGGTLREINQALFAARNGIHPEKPFVIVAQASLFDPARAPVGKHTVWAYCHVPAGSTTDMTEKVTARVETFAPGFRDQILNSHIMRASDMARYNPNYIGGDINGGIQDLRQLFSRPVSCFNPYSTPLPGLHICSSSTPPGGGVHGMCGVFAARSVLRRKA
jgi:phytoene dehydrogenase-like protein